MKVADTAASTTKLQVVAVDARDDTVANCHHPRGTTDCLMEAAFGFLTKVMLSDPALGLCSFVATGILITVVRLLGGGVYMLATVPVLAPVVGGLYRTIMVRGLHLPIAVKIVSMIVGACGALIAATLLQHLNPALLARPGVLWGMLAAVTVASLGVLERAATMVTDDLDAHLRLASQTLRLDLSGLDDEDRARLAHANHADNMIIGLLVLIVGYGMTMYCADALGLFDGQRLFSTPLQSVISAFDIEKILQANPHGPGKLWLTAIQGFYGVSLLIYTAVFIGVSTSLVQKPNKPSLAEVTQAFLSGLTARPGPETPTPRRWQHNFPRQRTALAPEMRRRTPS